MQLVAGSASLFAYALDLLQRGTAKTGLQDSLQPPRQLRGYHGRTGALALTIGGLLEPLGDGELGIHVSVPGRGLGIRVPDDQPEGFKADIANTGEVRDADVAQQMRPDLVREAVVRPLAHALLSPVQGRAHAARVQVQEE